MSSSSNTMHLAQEARAAKESEAGSVHYALACYGSLCLDYPCSALLVRSPHECLFSINLKGYFRKPTSCLLPVHCVPGTSLRSHPQATRCWAYSFRESDPVSTLKNHTDLLSECQLLPSSEMTLGLDPCPGLALRLLFSETQHH